MTALPPHGIDATASERRFAALVESLDGIVWEADARTLQFSYVSPPAERILGYPVARWLDEPDFWERHIHPDDRAATITPCLTAIREGRAHVLEYRMLAADGHAVWFRDVVTVEVVDGQPTIARGVMVDVTSHRELEAALEREHSRLSGFIEATDLGTWEWNLETGETLFNERLASMLGYTLAELAPVTLATWSALTHPGDLQRANERLERHFAGELPFYDCEMRMRHREGSWIWVHDRGRVTRRAPDGRPLRMVGTHQDITQRRRDEESLRLLSQLARGTTNGVVITDVEGRITWVNEAFTRISGYSFAELAGRVPGEVLQGPGTDPDAIERIGAAVARREPFEEELLNYRRDGRPYWVRISGAPVHDEAGSFAGFMAVQTDVTAGHEAAQALRAREALLARTGALAQVGGWELDLTTGALHWTAETRRIHEVPDDFVPTVERAIGFYAPEAQPVIRECVERGMSAGEPWDVELEIVTFTGRRRWVRAVGEVERRDGRPVRLWGAFQDITERRAAEDDLRRSRERFMLAVQGTQDGIWDWDMLTGEVFYSPRWLELIGYQPGEVPYVASTFFERIHPDDRPGLERHLRDYLEGRVPAYVAEFRFRRRDGSYAWHLARGLALRDGQGVPYRMAGSQSDITARKEAESERERLQARLQQADRLESIGRLAGGVAHDFNNMLSVILGNVALLQQGLAPGDPVRHGLDEVRHAAERSADLTRQLLGFSRQQPATPRDLDLAATIGGHLAMLRRLIGEDIALEWTHAPGLPTVRMDPAQLTQVLTNLVVNARDAIATTGRVTIHAGPILLDGAFCATRAGLVPGDFACLTVTDTGHGMEPEVLAHIFEPFFTTKALGRGTGLGLATVYGIVRQNEGWIDVESAVGAGTTFRVYLPASPLPAEAPGAADAADPSGSRPGRGEVVLVVEDEPSLLRLTCRMLEGLGYATRAAATPAEALAIADAPGERVDLVLTDVVMSGMNGRELADRLTARRPGLPCLFMSGYTADIIAQRGTLADGVRFLAKPFTRTELAERVSEALEGAPPAGG